MTRDDEVDNIMAGIPEDWRLRWCGGERGPCACIGCVQTGNKQVIAERITGERYRGDPEYISEAKLKEHAEYASLKVTREEWDAWKGRHKA